MTYNLPMVPSTFSAAAFVGSVMVRAVERKRARVVVAVVGRGQGLEASAGRVWFHF